MLPMTKTVATSDFPPLIDRRRKFYAAMIAPSGARPSVTKRQTLAALITAIAALVAPLPSLLAVENGPPNNGKGASALERVRVIISVKVPPASALAIASCWRMRVV
jgi:hypothetical protein